MNTLDLASKKVNLKKASNTHGGEYWGPCPVCGGKDRFHVWPKQNNGKGGYWCRGCGKAGDNIQFLIDFEGMDFKSACAYLNIQMPDHAESLPEKQEKPAFTPATHQSPAQLWQEKAEKFLTWSQLRLGENAEVIKWLSARGISLEAAVEARLGWNPGENGKDIFRSRKAWGLPEIKKENGKPRMLWIPIGLVIPYITNRVVQRLRIRRPNEVLEKIRLEHPDSDPPRYYVIPGSSMSTMVIGPDRRAFVIIESELDAIACAAPQDLAGAIATGTLEGKPDSAAYAILKEAIQILNALDYGDQGGGKKAAERAMKWWSENFKDRCDRWPVPKGKDPGEAYAMGIDLEKWIKAGLPPVLTINEKPKEIILPSSKPPQAGINEKEISAKIAGKGLSPLIFELWQLLQRNPSVKIINTPERFTIERNGKHIGGRIHDLVYREKDVSDFIFNHSAEKIDGNNLIN
jgi:hypothetical protein